MAHELGADAVEERADHAGETEGATRAHGVDGSQDPDHRCVEPQHVGARGRAELEGLGRQRGVDVHPAEADRGLLAQAVQDLERGELGAAKADAHAAQGAVAGAGRGLHPLQAIARSLPEFHFGRFDIAVLEKTFGTPVVNVYCTKIASRLVRTYTDRHGLKDITRELLGIELSKQQQSSDWGAAELTEAQCAYAASDVLHLHDLKTKLDILLEREGRTALAQSCFNFLPARAALDLAGWDEIDIFAHS